MMKKLIIVAVACYWFPVDSHSAGRIAESDTVVVTKADDVAIRRILDDWRNHQEKVAHSSMTEPYFDCKAHVELLEYGRKAAPYLIAQLARQQTVEPYLGRALIHDPNIKTPEQVYLYNQRRKTDLHNRTLAHWILTGVLTEIMPPEDLEKAPKRGRTKIVDWMAWWRKNRKKFVFADAVSAGVVLPRDRRPLIPQISTSAKKGLLDICAVHATYRQMIERAAAEMGIKTFIGEQRYIEVIGTVWMKSVTYDEFLYIVGRNVYIKGFDYRKAEDGYWVGGEEPAKPRAILKGWGIKMPRTAFAVGEDIPVTVVTRGIPDPANVDKAVFARCGSFRITKNDGTVVKEFAPPEDACVKVPPAKRIGPSHEVELLLNRFHDPGVGEFNIQYRYQGQQTPTIAIEVYPGDSKHARRMQLLPASRTKTKDN